jgi:hypothetical protein
LGSIPVGSKGALGLSTTGMSAGFATQGFLQKTSSITFKLHNLFTICRSPSVNRQFWAAAWLLLLGVAILGGACCG